MEESLPSLPAEASAGEDLLSGQVWNPCSLCLLNPVKVNLVDEQARWNKKGGPMVDTHSAQDNFKTLIIVRHPSKLLEPCCEGSGAPPCAPLLLGSDLPPEEPRAQEEGVSSQGKSDQEPMLSMPAKHRKGGSASLVEIPPDLT